MTKQMLEEYHELIINMINELTKSVNESEKDLKPIEPDTSLGRLTRLDAMQSQKIAESNIRSKKMRIEKLKQTLMNMQNGNFGICSLCEEEIEEKRLKIVPETNVCMECLKESR